MPPRLLFPIAPLLPSPRCRPPLDRIQRIHEALCVGDFPNCRTLVTKIEVSPKTIQRDIDFMRDRRGLPIDYDPIRFGFYYTAPVPHFPPVEVSEGELVALLVAQKALRKPGTGTDITHFFQETMRSLRCHFFKQSAIGIKKLLWKSSASNRQRAGGIFKPSGRHQERARWIEMCGDR